jgi:hypothetical protein
MKTETTSNLPSRTLTPALALLAIYGVASSALAASFAGPASFAAAFRPAGIALADYNGDGRRDMAVAVDAPDRVLIYINNAAPGGGFNAPVAFPMPAGSGPDSLAAGDFDRDGDMDIAVVLKNNNQVTIMTNNGTAQFLTQGAYATGAEPVSLAAGDLDNDADLDLVTANREGNSLSVLRNNAGVFVVTTIGAGTEPRDAAIGDLNADGLRDLAASNHRDRTISTYLNIGGGNFAPRVSYAVGGTVRPDGIAIADITGDGRNDVITSVSGNALNLIAVFPNTPNTGNGVLGPAVSSPTGGVNPSSVIAVDIDGDNDADIITNNEDSAQLSVLINTNGTLAAPMLLATAPGSTPDAIAVADLNGAPGSGSLPEIVVSNRDADTVFVFTNTTPPPCRADFNNNGSVDFFDYLDFVQAFANESPTADFNQNGTVDFFDYLDFVQAFAAGC